MKTLYPTVKLFGELSGMSYPPGIVHVPSQIPGLAFFPGGRGVYQNEGSEDLPPFPRKQVMIVGQDFDTVQNFRKSLRLREESRRKGTWGSLLPVLDRAGISRKACFFTNAYMGLRASGKNTGPSLGSQSEAFRDACKVFFLRQLALQEPRLILCLGTQVTRFLAACATDLSAWGAGSFGSIDSSGTGVMFDVHITGARTVPTVVALVHPSFRTANVGRRKYGDCQGDEAEQAMLRDAIAHIGGIAGSPV